MHPLDVDRCEQVLDAIISGASHKAIVLPGEYPEIMRFLIHEGGRPLDRISQIREKYLRVFDIQAGYDFPDPPPLIPVDLLDDLQKAVNDKGELNWHMAADIISERIAFAALVSSNEFLYYDPATGTWVTGAEELIEKILRDSYRDIATRYIKEEVIAHLRGTHYVFSEFQGIEGLLINCQNGVLESSTMRLLPHSPDYHFRYVLPVRFDKRAKCPAILNFLEEATVDDLNKALKLLEFYAYCLMPGYPIQKACTLLGNGNNGKSVTLGILSAFLGPKNIIGISLQTLAYSRFAGAELRNRLANISGDVAGGTLKDTSFFKLITGGDPVSAEIKMIQKRPLFYNSTKLIFAFNQLPRSTDQTRGFFRRFEIVKFIQDFTGREDRQLLKKLTTPGELSGLLNLLAGIFVPALYAKEEFHDPMTIEELQLEYNLSADPALAFIQERIEADNDGHILVEELYSHFLTWCKGRGLNVPTPEAFGYSLRNFSGMMVQKKREQERGVQRNYYVGIKYIEPVPLEMAAEFKLHSDIKIPKTLVEAIYYYVQRYIDHHESCIGCIGFSTLYMFRGIDPIHVKSSKSYATYETYATFNETMNNNHDDVLIAISKDISIAWIDRDYHFHSQDMVHVPRKLADILIKRGIASEAKVGS